MRDKDLFCRGSVVLLRAVSLSMSEWSSDKPRPASIAACNSNKTVFYFVSLSQRGFRFTRGMRINFFSVDADAEAD